MIRIIDDPDRTRSTYGVRGGSDRCSRVAPTGIFPCGKAVQKMIRIIDPDHPAMRKKNIGVLLYPDHDPDHRVPLQGYSYIRIMIRSTYPDPEYPCRGTPDRTPAP